MDGSSVGFAVVYRWRLREGSERRFRDAWETVTRSLMAQRGALGSRLHLAEDGSWVAYAQWPDRDAWERSRAEAPLDPTAMATMRDAIEEALPPILLSPVRDHLVCG